MPPQTLEKRVEELEDQVRALQGLPAQVAQLTLKISHLRQEMQGGFSALRAEDQKLRKDMRALHKKAMTRMDALHKQALTEMRVLHEAVLAQFALMREGSGGGSNSTSGKGNGPRR